MSDDTKPERGTDMLRTIAQHLTRERMNYRRTLLVVILRAVADQVDKHGWKATQAKLPNIVATAKEVTAPYFTEPEP